MRTYFSSFKGIKPSVSLVTQYYGITVFAVVVPLFRLASRIALLNCLSVLLSAGLKFDCTFDYTKGQG